jgi:transcriptional regulator with XRE-family HTH domain
VAGVGEVNPTVARRELAVYFNRLREQRGRSLGDLAGQLNVAQSQASRLDKGVRGFRLSDVELLSDWYGLAEGERARLLALAGDARRRAWWQQTDLDDAYRTLIGLEQAAESISEYCYSVVPGLLQTRNYARVLGELAELRPEVTEVAVDVRMRRQQILDRPNPPELTVIIDEAALARGPGPEMKVEQLEKLLEFARRPRTTVQVIGFEAGLYPLGVSQFILLEMGSRLPVVYYSEDQFRRADTTDEDTVRRARQLWKVLQSKALDPVRSAHRIAQHRDDLARH